LLAPPAVFTNANQITSYRAPGVASNARSVGRASPSVRLPKTAWKLAKLQRLKDSSDTASIRRVLQSLDCLEKNFDKVVHLAAGSGSFLPD